MTSFNLMKKSMLFAVSVIFISRNIFCMAFDGQVKKYISTYTDQENSEKPASNINTVNNNFKMILAVKDTTGKKLYEENFINPKNGKTIKYKGAGYRGRGTFYFIKDNSEKFIVETKIYYGPQVYWHGDNIAEIFLPYGSPFNASYLYNSDTGKLSELFPSILAVFPEEDAFVCGDVYGIFHFIRISTGIPIQDIKIDGIGCSWMELREAFDIKMDRDKIKIGVSYMPYTYKLLNEMIYYEFEH